MDAVSPGPLTILYRADLMFMTTLDVEVDSGASAENPVKDAGVVSRQELSQACLVHSFSARGLDLLPVFEHECDQVIKERMP